MVMGRSKRASLGLGKCDRGGVMVMIMGEVLGSVGR